MIDTLRMIGRLLRLIAISSVLLLGAAVSASGDPQSFSVHLRPQATGTLDFSCRQGETAPPQVVSVTTDPAAPNAPFTVSSNVSWLSVNPMAGNLNSTGSTTLRVTASCFGRTPGSYSGTLSLIVPGTSGDSIPATLIVSGGCTYGLNPPNQSFSSAGGSDRIGVTTSASCSWMANSNSGWIRILSGSSGTGSGSVTYSVEANTDPQTRTGTINVQGQVFTISQAGITLGSTYYQIVSRNSGMALDVRNTSTSPGALIQQYPYLGGANQQWQLIPATGGSYVIISRNSGMALDVQNTSKSAGALIQQYPYIGGANQSWQLTPVIGGFYEIVSQNSGMALDVKDVSTSPGALIQQYPYTGGANQQWQLVPIQ